MKTILLLSAFASIMFSCNAQLGKDEGTEFTTHSNGLIYSEGDMRTLRYIVDSLNLRFKTCDLSRKYYSMPQGRYYEVYFVSETNDLRSVIADLEKMSFHELINKHSSLVKSYDTSSLLIKGDDFFLSGSPAEGYDYLYLSDDRKSNPRTIPGKWLHRYSSRKSHSNYYSLTCYFFPEEIRTSLIPTEYAALIQYVDCMIDTSAVIFLNDKEDRRPGSVDDNLYEEINSYLNFSMKRKKQGKNDWEFGYITADKIKYAFEHLKTDSHFIRLVDKAGEAAIQDRQSNEQLETLVAGFISKEKALYLKRCRRVVGRCSMDDSPRQHAKDIALLAAEAHSWDIFLRAHLDIMNDRFERRSDGSYAWGQRQTYLKELEELNLNVVDLMLGLALRARNTADNHYYGSISRMGRALSESKDKEIFEKKAIAMMKDSSLDEFNRGLIFLLYSNYTYYLSKEKGKKKRDDLRGSIETFPNFIQESINKLKEPKDEREG